MVKRKTGVKENCNINYPKIMHSNLSGLIVLMLGRGDGFVLVEDSDDEVGKTSAWDMDCFEDFEGDLILHNA